MRLLLVVVATAGALLAACQGTSEQSEYRESIPRLDQVQAVTIGVYPFTDQPFLPLLPGDAEGRVAWLLDQLRRAPLTDQVSDESWMLGHFGPQLSFIVGRRQALYVTPSADCYPEGGGNFPEARGAVCRGHPSHARVSAGDRSWLVTAPELAKWMAFDGAWQDVPTGSRDELGARLAALFPTLDVPSGVPEKAWLASPELKDQWPLPLTLSTPAGRAALESLVEWLKAATPGSEKTETPPSLRFTDRWLNIEFSADRWLVVHPAYECISDGRSEPCYRVPDEVIVDDGTPLRPPYHLKAPDLAQWLADGWRQDLAMGTKEEYDRLVRPREP